MASKYPEIKSYILEQIDKGIYIEGVMLPAENYFTELFSVSRMTIRRAFDELIQDGVLIRKRGSGVFLTKKKIERSIMKVSVSHDEDINSMFENLSIKILDFKIVHDHYIVKKYLGLDNEDAYQIKRVQLGDNHPIVYENIFLPTRYFANLKREDCQQSMSEIVEKHTVVQDISSKKQISVESKLSTKTVSTILQTPINSPILQLNIVIVGREGEKYYCGLNSYLGENFIYSTEEN